MEAFELVIGLLFVGAILSGVARSVRAPYPALLALAGAALALLPGTPSVMLDPELALTLFVAPVLLDAAYDASPRDLKENWRAVTSLAIVAVGVTVAGVALVARWLNPELPWAAAIALGAIVAPPDAAAATAVLRQLQPPHRVLVILEGESLFNDASSLLVYRLAVGAAMTGSFSGWSALPMLGVATAGSLVLGWLLARVVLVATPHIQDVSLAIIVQFLSTFAVWMLAEKLHLSGIITMVVFAIAVARKAPDLIPARLRIPSYAVWELVVFILNVLAFILIGLSLKPIIAGFSRATLIDYLGTAAAVCGAVILVRIVWVLGYVVSARWMRRLRVARRLRRPARFPSSRASVIVAWCGMRGIVTLATALALPAAFPQRGLVLFVSFSVVLVTLVAQGMTLTPLMRLLRIQSDDSIDREVNRARAETARAALDAVDRAGHDRELITLLRRKFEARLLHAEGRGTAGDDDDLRAFTDVLRASQAAERRALSSLRADGTIGDDAFHRVEEELDRAEINADSMIARS